MTIQIPSRLSDVLHATCVQLSFNEGAALTFPGESVTEGLRMSNKRRVKRSAVTPHRSAGLESRTKVTNAGTDDDLDLCAPSSQSDEAFVQTTSCVGERDYRVGQMCRDALADLRGLSGSTLRLSVLTDGVPFHGPGVANQQRLEGLRGCCVLLHCCRQQSVHMGRTTSAREDL